MARISISFVLLALAAATGSATAATTITNSADIEARAQQEVAHPGADIVGFSKRVDISSSPSTNGAASHSKKSTKRKRRAHGRNQARDASFEARDLPEVPQPIKRDLNTPSDPTKLHKVALTRAHNPATSGVHPQILIQQHINRGVRRLNRMTKREHGEALDAEFENAIRKRWVGIYGHDGDLKLRKRQRGGHAASDAVSTGLEEVDANELKQDGAQVEAAAAAGGAAGQAAAAAAGGADTAGAGFSQKDLKALEQGTVTKPGTTTAANSVGLNIEANDVGYFATVGLGTPAQNFKILLDSGSADFWVPGENCATCGNHLTLGATASSSFVNTNKKFQVTYGTGNVAGLISQDNVNIAGLDLANHTFGVTTKESNDFGSNQVPFDGLMGLAISTLSEQQTPTPIESLASNGLVTAAQMGFALGRVADATNIGEATFGGVDNTKFDGDLTLFNNVNKQGFWEGAMADVTVDGKSTGLTGRTAILDTGTTLVIAPPKDAAAVHAAIPGAASDGQGGFTVPCTTSAKVALTFGGKQFEMNPQDLAFQPLTNNLKGNCVSSISAGQIGGAKEWLVGDAFLKSVYFATDVENNAIGLAPISKAAAAA